MFKNPIFSEPIVSESLLSDAEIMQLIYAAPENTLLNSNQLSQSSRIGEQIASTTGSGSDFAEVRAYQPGDEPRHIDWRATARSQYPLVRTYHSEFSQPLCLLIDRRLAMRFATRVRLKVTQALRMALWIGGGAARSGREISAVLLDYPCHWLPSQQGMLSLRSMAKLANLPCPPLELEDTQQINWQQILSGLEQHIPKGSELILLSDFSGLGDDDNKMLCMLGHHCIVRAIHIFDPSESVDQLEINTGFSGALKLQWGDKIRYFSATKAAAIEHLKNELQVRSEAIARRFRQADMDYVQLSVEQDELTDFWFRI